MASLVFLCTVLTLFVLFILIVIKLTKHQAIKLSIIIFFSIILMYAITWGICRLNSRNIAVPMGTEVCFDDWCATVNSNSRLVIGDSISMVLNITVSNYARGIAQKPSEPRVHIVDADGRAWSISYSLQKLYEKKMGIQPRIDQTLELHQSLKTVLVFAVPHDIKSPQALIEEGPWLTNLLFPSDQMVFDLNR